MTSQLNVDTIVDKAGSGGTNVKIANTSTYVGEGGSGTQNLVQGFLKAWTRTNSSDTTVDSFNMSSVEDSGTGYFTPNLANNMNNTNYGFLSGGDDNNDGASIFVYNLSSSYTVTTSQFRMSFKKYSYALRDPNHNATVAIAGDLA